MGLITLLLPLFSFGLKQISILKMVAVEFTLMGILMACVFAGVHTLNTRVKVVGWACVASGVLMYGSTIPALVSCMFFNFFLFLYAFDETNTDTNKILCNTID